MRRLLLFLLLLTASAAGWAQHDAMYVYRNDGAINAFLKSDIDSIRYSKVDTDSISHEQYVVQEVWTPDSTYRIPLAAVDSVSFVTPPTVYKEGVVDMSHELVDYIIGVDGRTLKLSPVTPILVRPRKGNILVLLDGCEVLPNGFSGRVKSVRANAEGVSVVCEEVTFDDVFESYCNISSVYGYVEDETDAPAAESASRPQRVVYDPKTVNVRLGKITRDIGAQLSPRLSPDGDLTLQFGLNVSSSLTPTLKVKVFIIKDKAHGFYFSSTVTGELLVGTDVSMSGGINYEHDFPVERIIVPIPAAADMVNFYVDAGAFFRANAKISSTINAQRTYAFGWSYDYSSIGQNELKHSLFNRLVSKTFDETGSIDGTVETGLFVETGFNVVLKEIANVSVRGERGIRLSGNFVLRNSDIDKAERETAFYERLKASSLGLGLYDRTALQASVFTLGGNMAVEHYNEIGNWAYVPTFSDTSLDQVSTQRTSAYASAVASGNCLFPVSIGMALFDHNKNKVSHYTGSKQYTNHTQYLNHTFSGLNLLQTYTVYPTVNIFGHDILATPTASVTLGGVCPVITKFEQTDSHYSKGAYHNNGRDYDFKYNAAVTAEIETLDGVDRWGYVYMDPDGKTAEIPMSGLKHTDTNHAYYRNSASATVHLCGYAYLKGCDQPIYGEMREFYLSHQMAGAMTGEYKDVTKNSAVVTCSYTNVPKGATCGVEYSTDEENWHQTSAASNEGTQTITLSGLQPDTKYYYRAYIKDGAQMYYGGTADFTTLPEPPDVAGSWTCTIFLEDKNLEFTITLNADGTATQTGSDRIPEDERGSWSIYSDGTATIAFSWVGGGWINPIWICEQYSGKVDNLKNPSHIKGTVFRGYTGNQGGTYGGNCDFEMSR